MPKCLSSHDIVIYSNSQWPMARLDATNEFVEALPVVVLRKKTKILFAL